MKKTITTICILCFAGTIVSGQNSGGMKTDPAGNWKFEAPYAPEGYTSGTLTVSLNESKYDAAMTFTGIDYKFKAENVKVANDSLTFSVYVEGNYVNLSLRVEDRAKMSGKAVYSEGVIPLALIRSEEEQAK
jgi:hypothetical protein